MFKRLLLGCAVVTMAVLATAAESWAGYRICNRSGQRIDAAFGYPHPQFGWTSEGWWTIQPGRCRTVMQGDLTNRYYYVYATGSDGGLWQGPDAQQGGVFCVQTSKFVFQNNNFIKGKALDCEAHNLQTRKFILVDTGGAPNHVHNLSD